MRISRNLTLLCLAAVLAFQAASAETLRVMSYNIRSGSGDSSEDPSFFGKKFFFGRGDKYLDPIADKMKAQKVDLVCLQEIQARNLRSLFYDQTKYLAKKLGFNYRWALSSKDLGGVVNRQGNAILSRWPIREVRRVELIDGSGKIEPRIALVARVAFPAAGQAGIWVISTHLDNNTPEAMNTQIDVLARTMSQLEGPALLAGDFNATPGSPALKRMLGGDLGRPMHDGLAELGLGDLKTSPSKAPRRRIDFILHDDSFTALRGGVPHKGAEQSDHLPVVTEYRFAPAAPAGAQTAEAAPSFDGLNG